MRVYRLEPKTGIKRYAVKENGFYVLGNYKKYGRQQHTVANRVLVRTEQEMIDLIKQGHYVRVEDDVRPDLVRKNLYIDGIKVT
ncbi:hypothetical protein [Ochrobactrum soli]|uniref:Uncharacterized protein n=1 Tax=Ochrobactrum soli TaxID=2448455 RepID=A0A849KI10_9HYPH|nr:hypothetical protein [[Ochrobactrum] soli]NNU59090.1 hypothetical protein [[Ochrobactrum] soli]